jgi:hypothetical protein
VHTSLNALEGGEIDTVDGQDKEGHDADRHEKYGQDNDGVTRSAQGLFVRASSVSGVQSTGKDVRNLESGNRRDGDAVSSLGEDVRETDMDVPIGIFLGGVQVCVCCTCMYTRVCMFVCAWVGIHAHIRFGTHAGRPSAAR